MTPSEVRGLPKLFFARPALNGVAHALARTVARGGQDSMAAPTECGNELVV